MIEHDDQAASLLEEATDWLIARQAAPDDAVLAGDLDTWLARSAAHRAAFARAERAWVLLGKACPRTIPAGDALRPRPAVFPPSPAPASPSRMPHARSSAAAFLGVGVCVAALLAAPAVLLRWQADVATGTAEIRTLALEDGTTITLGPASALSADLSGSERRVRLFAGEAYFDVARDPARPFRVEAGGAEIAATGTRFDVRLLSDTAYVALESGAVTVSSAMKGAGKGAPGELEPVPNAADLLPGDAITIERETGRMTASRVSPENAAAWRSGRLFVEAATIAEVVETIRRHHPAFVLIFDDALGRETVTGLYDLHSPDRALAALVAPHGGRVRAVSPYLRVLSRD